MDSKYRYLGYEPVILSQSSLDSLGISGEDKNSLHMSGRKGIYIEADRALSILEERSKGRNKKEESRTLRRRNCIYIQRDIHLSNKIFFH